LHISNGLFLSLSPLSLLLCAEHIFCHSYCTIFLITEKQKEKKKVIVRRRPPFSCTKQNCSLVCRRRSPTRFRCRCRRHEISARKEK
jgi:hypothetical protein